MRKITLLTLIFSLLSPPLRAEELTAYSDVITYSRESRIGLYYNNSNVFDVPPRGMSWGMQTGFDNFIDNTLEPALKAIGMKVVVIGYPFGQRRYFVQQDGTLLQDPHDAGDAMQFTMYKDCERDIPAVTRSFVPAWKKFFRNHPDVKVIMCIGSLRTDIDTANYLFGNSDDAQVNAMIKRDPIGQEFYDLPSYATDPQKLKTIWPDYIWPNIVPILEGGVRSIMFDSGSEYTFEPGLTWYVGEKLRHPEKRDPVVDKMLIDAIGNEKVEVIIETRPDKGPNKHFKGYSTMVLDGNYFRGNPAGFPDAASEKLADSDLGTVYGWDVFEEMDPVNFGKAKKMILAGDTALIYPPWVMEQYKDNIFGVTTIDGIYSALGINSIPSNVKLRADNPGNKKLEYVITREPRHGTLSHPVVSYPNITDPSYVRYTPDPGYYGTDSFMFKVRADDGTESNWGTIYINPANAAAPSDPANEATDASIGLFKNVIGAGYGESAGIPFRFEKNTPVRIDIYSHTGTLVRQLVDRDFPIGEHTVTWDGKDEAGVNAASGMYLAKIKLDKKVVTKKIVVVR